MKNVVVGKNDLATTHPLLAKEADGWDPKTVIAGTGKKLNWKCSKDHKWEAAGSNRVKGSGCPVCFIDGIDGFESWRSSRFESEGP